MSTAAIKRGEGESCVFVAPTGGVTIHLPVLIGNVVVIPMETKAQTLNFQGAIEGVWECDASGSDTIAAGDLLSWDHTNAVFRRSLSFTELTGDLNGCAIAVAPKAGSATRVWAKLCPGSGNVV